jgi:hypothetical protein
MRQAFACYYHRRSSLRTLGCHAFFDHGLFAHGTGSHHHERCRKTRLDFAGFSAHTCDAIARHVDSHCRWQDIGQRAILIHFKGKGKPWKHLPPPCVAAQFGPLRLTPLEGGAPVPVHETLWWAHGASVCRTAQAKAVLFSNGGRVPRVCCESYMLQKAVWVRATTKAPTRERVRPL